MLLDAIDHVQLAMPPGGEPLARWFYGEMLGMPETPKPPHLAVRGGCWFERGVVRIHLGVQEDFVPATKAHPAFTVSDLDRLRRELTVGGIAVRAQDDPVLGPQLYVDDPFGNRLEFRGEREVEPLAPMTDTIADVATEAVGDRLAAQLRFVQELDRLKTVERQSLILDGHRRENTAEHSWHVAMLALILAEHADPDVDIGRVVQLLLVHDVVEIDAGDTGIYDDDLAGSKHEREQAAADRLFGILPDDLAADLREVWEEYEAAQTPEARFARVFDRLSPFLLNLSSAGLAWARWEVDVAQVRQVMSGVGAAAPELGRFVAAMLDRAVAEGLLPEPRSSLIVGGDAINAAMLGELEDD